MQEINNSSIPPCQNACPVKTRARDYVRATAMGRLEEAYKIITENNPFPSVCGRVCMHPCEEACRRNSIDEPISIAALKRYDSDYVNENGLFIDTSSIITSGKKVAVIGAGPSGLAAAVKVVEAGHKVEVFERNEKAGGMLRYGIPRYRLSDAALDEDIKRIEAKGVKINTGKAVGADINLDDLLQEYDAALVSVGLSDSRALPVEGMDAAGVHLAIPFLKSPKDTKAGNKILVIGGGNVAIDVAKTARRLNTNAEVTMACLECAEEMPASVWEIKEAIEEKIEIRNCMGPRKIEVKGGKAAGMRFITCASVFDKEGRFNPSFKEDEKHFIEADTIIVAIGQQADLSFLPGELTNNGRLIYDGGSLAVTEDGLFACGEVAKGPGAAIAAIAHGNDAGKAINQYLAGQEINLIENESEVIGELPAKVVKKIVKKERQQTSHVAAAVRIKNFDEFDNGLDKQQATKEALRCMDCGSGAFVNQDKCVACLTCVRVCPFNVAQIDKKTNVAEMPAEGCQACGACAADCPANAIDLGGYSLAEILEEVRAAKAQTVGFICQSGQEVNFPGVHQIRVKCPIRLSEGVFLESFAAGAKKVFVICHSQDDCRYIKGGDYVKRRVGYVKEILDNIGIGSATLEVFDKNQKEEIKAFLK